MLPFGPHENTSASCVLLVLNDPNIHRIAFNSFLKWRIPNQFKKETTHILQKPNLCRTSHVWGLEVVCRTDEKLFPMVDLIIYCFSRAPQILARIVNHWKPSTQRTTHCIWRCTPNLWWFSHWTRSCTTQLQSGSISIWNQRHCLERWFFFFEEKIHLGSCPAWATFHPETTFESSK